MSKKYKTSKVGRFTQLAKGIGKASFQFVKEKSEQKINNVMTGKKIDEKIAQIKATKELVKTMSNMKGAVMKVGQMLSITDNLFLPKEITDLFKSLQKNSSNSLKEEEIDEIFFDNFNKKTLQIFDHFEYKPFAAASIGQVHKATYKGHDVVVKIQYPYIKDTIHSDLDALTTLETLIRKIYKNIPDISQGIEEIKDNFVLECDYLNEVKNMSHLKKSLKKRFPQIIVPTPYKEVCSDNIITMSYEQGYSFDELAKKDQTLKNNIGTTLYEFFLFSLFELKFIHADPQNGNYLFQDDKIILLDFGCCKKFKKGFIENYSLLCYSVEIGDKQLFKYAATKLGIFQKHYTDKELDRYYKLTKDVYGPFTKKGAYQMPDLNPFQLINSFFKEIRTLKDRKMPNKDLLLLDRANVGLFTKLKTLKVSIDWSQARDEFQSPITQEAYNKYKEKNK